ncbi:hypothetical protein NIES37_48170 [Tolypothrix tenuis PCC 7101]|uniref:DUF928 domain-containing protein n=1 Tax=Tolypothrix tenuis PCC 7101 TaxID=231146 RepID=A0A1Z4N556_9CYAN|nr:hypothetical protein NIES37_48170 [Tolypothrix tenuis PCC 7101]BAZ75256.1 hypothetical protein NIES50_38380 [Aulosira laxa NIES-50]
MKFISSPMKLSLALAVSCTIILLGQTSIVAGPGTSRQLINTKSSNTTITTVNFNVPTPPPEPPPGGRVLGGAKRGTCPLFKPELTALVPFIKKADSTEDVWGLTTAAHPTFWFYLPLPKNWSNQVEFTLQGEGDKQIYQTAIAPPKQPGVIGVSLPKNVAPLELNKQYRWFLSVYCDPEKQSPPIYVEGVIQRVNLNQAIAQKLEKAQPQQQLEIYAQNGIWYETVTILAQLRQKNPNDSKLQAEWQNLITSIGLSNVATQPIVSQ